jgi:hypothetical protein
MHSIHFAMNHQQHPLGSSPLRGARGSGAVHMSHSWPQYCAIPPVGFDQLQVPDLPPGIHFQLIVHPVVSIRVNEHLKVIVVKDDAAGHTAPHTSQVSS